MPDRSIGGFQTFQFDPTAKSIVFLMLVLTLLSERPFFLSWEIGPRQLTCRLRHFAEVEMHPNASQIKPPTCAGQYLGLLKPCLMAGARARTEDLPTSNAQKSQCLDGISWRFGVQTSEFDPLAKSVKLFNVSCQLVIGGSDLRPWAEISHNNLSSSLNAFYCTKTGFPEEISNPQPGHD